MNSTESIITELQRMAKEKGVLEPEILLTAAEKLCVLIQMDADILAEKEFELAQARKNLLDEGKNSTETKLRIEASPLFLECRKIKNRIDTAKEFTRLSKLHSRLASDMLRN